MSDEVGEWRGFAGFDAKRGKKSRLGNNRVIMKSSERGCSSEKKP